MQHEVTQSQVKMQRQLKEIYDILLKFGFPGLVKDRVARTNQEIEESLSDYLQPSIKRQNMIEWLIINIDPNYSSQIQQRNNKQKSLVNQLWKLGVMPFSKHTQNLDYQKYVQGLLGLQNSINLLFNLCVLVKQYSQFGKSKEDGRFSAFLSQIFANYDTLINVDYDPYKISFPASYQNLNDEQFEEEYRLVMQQLQDTKQRMRLQPKQNSSSQIILQQFQQNKVKFQEKYEQLVKKMKEVIEKHSGLIASWKKIQNIEGRTLKISPSLSQTYRKYKQAIKISKLSTSKLRQQKLAILSLIESLNETVSLE